MSFGAFPTFPPCSRLTASCATALVTTMRQFDWDDLRIFLVIGQLHSLSLAAKRLHLDHSTVSRRLSKLEVTLGQRLIERRPDGIVLTPVGRDLLIYAEAMAGQVIAAQNSMFGTLGDERETVRLSTYEGLSSLFLAARLEPFARQNPQIDVEISTSLQPVRVERRDADVFLSFYRPEGRSLHTEEIGTIALFLFGSSAYFSEHGYPDNKEQLQTHKFVTYINEYLTIESVRWLDEVLVNPSTQIRSTSMITQMNLAARGCGLVLLPAFSPIEQASLLPILVDQIRVERKIWLSAHRDTVYLPKIKKFLRFIKDVLDRDHDILVGTRFLQ